MPFDHSTDGETEHWEVPIEETWTSIKFMITAAMRNSMIRLEIPWCCLGASINDSYRSYRTRDDLTHVMTCSRGPRMILFSHNRYIIISVPPRGGLLKMCYPEGIAVARLLTYSLNS